MVRRSVSVTRRLVDRLRAAGCVFAEEEAEILLDSARSEAELEAMASQRAAGRPLEHVVGWAEFRGLRLRISPGVFVPRRRSQFMVDCALAVTTAPAVVVDVCCGSGALGIAVREVLGDVELYAVDIDPDAVACAAANLGDAGTVLLGDLFEPLPGRLRGRVDLVLANVPYVPTEQLVLLPAEARLHERHLALDGGGDGLDALRRVASGVSEWLRPGGHLLFEITEGQAPTAAAEVAALGLEPSLARSEEWEAVVLVARSASRH
jgi:release factor glutamine methyltransferase